MVTATVRVGYTDAVVPDDRPTDDPRSSDDPTGQVLIEIPGQISFDGLVVNVYPSDPDAVAATVGTVEALGTRILAVRSEAVAFRGSARARISRPGAAVTSLAPVGRLFALSGTDLIGSEQLAIGFDPATNEVVVRTIDSDQIAVYGAIDVAYSADYARYRYRPEVADQTTTQGSVQRTITYGSVVAVKDTGVAVKEIEPPQRSYDDPDWIKLYEVHTQIVLDPDGAWEFPEGFPDSNTFPGIAGGPDQDSYVVDRRIHEIGYLQRTGRLDVRQFARTNPFTWEQPYTNNIVYRPEYQFSRLTSPPEGFDAAYQRVDWGDIASHIQSRYGLTI